MNDADISTYILPLNAKRTLEIGKRLSSRPAQDTDMPLVSVITVVYNNAETLQRCMDSVRDQIYPNVEYIVIDGGSSDGTVDIIKANAADIDYAVSEPDRGIYDAMNKGIGLARGDYIALINSDDWLELDGIQISLDNIIANNADISIGFAKVWDKHGEFSHIWKIGNFDARILTSGMSFCHQGLIASRRAYQMVGPFDDTIRISSDYKWIKGLYLTGLKAVFTEVPVVNFSFDGLAANNRPIWKEECKKLLTDQFDFWSAEDVSAFLEYVYRDGPLDKVAVTNLVMSAGSSPLLLQSLSLVLLDKLWDAELPKQNVASMANRCAPKPAVRGAFSVADLPAAATASATVTASAPTSARPKISVIIPVYNVEDYLEACLRSVMQQSLSDIEIICVNDGSPDNSQDILDRLAAEDPRIKIIVKQNGGLSSARNAGIRAATGEFIHFLDSDDYILPGMYAKMYPYAHDNGLELLKSNLGFIDQVYPTKRPILPKAEFFTFQDCPAAAQFISPCTALYSTDLLRRVAPFAEGMTYEDRPFNWETLIQAKRIGHVDEVFYMYRVDRPGSIMSSRKGNRRHFDAFRALDLLRDHLTSSGLMDKYKVEYAKEQLRVYSMLIDIEAIPHQDYGLFYWEICDRVNQHPVPVADIDKTNLPPRVKALYEFVLNGTQASARKQEGEQYFFHAMPYQITSKRYAASSCELFMIAQEAITRLFQARPLSDEDAFRKAVLLSLMFEYIHGRRALSVDTVRTTLGALEQIITQNDDFRAIVQGLHAQGTKPQRRSIAHLGFQYSRSPNYQTSRDFMTAFFEARQLDAQFLTYDDLAQEELPNTLLPAYRATLAAIKATGLRPNNFSQIVSARLYVDRNIDLGAVQTFTSLFVNSAPERYLIELLRGRAKIVSVPHGMPQISLVTVAPDYVVAPTQGPEWQELYPEAKIVHAGWPEVIALPVAEKPAPKARKEVLFLSQVEGSFVHKLDDFVMLTNLFLSVVQMVDPALCDFNIRLRNEAELELLDVDLVAAARGRKNLRFTTLKDGPMSETAPDLIVSATSTGLLYAQYFDVPCLQLLSTRLFQHWSFALAPDDGRVDVQTAPHDILPRLLALLDGGDAPKTYLSLPPQERFARLDEIYGSQPDAAPARAAAAPQSPQTQAAPTPRPEGTPVKLHLSETQDFGDLSFANIEVMDFAGAAGTIDPFHVKLLRSAEGVGIELRQLDGAFQLLRAPHAAHVAHDDWGAKLTLFATADGQPTGPVLTNIAEDAQDLARLLAQLPTAGEKYPELRRLWHKEMQILSRAFAG